MATSNKIIVIVGVVGVAVGIALNSPLGWFLMLAIIGGGAALATRESGDSSA